MQSPFTATGRLWIRRGRALGAALAAVSLMALAALQRWGGAQQGPYATLPLPAGVTELILSADGTRVIATSVTYNLKQSAPERVVTAIDTGSGRILWQRTLAAQSCCAFPVFSTTPDVEWVAVGGTNDVDVFRFAGTHVARVSLGPGPALNNVVRIDRDGRRAVAGQTDGRITAFALGKAGPVWRAHAGADLLDLALGTNGEVAASTLEAVVVFSGTPPAPRSRVRIGPAPVVVLAGVDGGFAVAWRGSDERVRIGVMDGGRWRWRRLLGRATVPVLHVDASGRWIAVSDFLGDGAWLVSGDGQIAWRAPQTPAAATVAPDGRAVLIVQDRVAVASAGARQLLWQGRLPGRAHGVRLGGSVLAVLGSKNVRSVLPDQLWLFRVTP
jgi:hypothetical protein